MNLSAKVIMCQLAGECKDLKEVTKEEKDGLQQILVSMLKDISEVCNSNNINFILVGGTALGAVRHRGFIPWDDDIDIAMTRNDWEIFKKIFPDFLTQKYEMEAPGFQNKDTKVTWGKIYRKNTELIEIQDINMPFNNGVFIDIFIMENVSNVKIIRIFDAIISDAMKFIATSQLYYKYPNSLMNQFMRLKKSSAFYFMMRKLIGLCFSCISHRTWCKWFDQFVSRHKGETKAMTIPTGRKHYRGEMLDWNIIFPYSNACFEGLNVAVPHKVDKYLINLYGRKYMQLPPIDKREKHFVIRLKY